MEWRVGKSDRLEPSHLGRGSGALLPRSFVQMCAGTH